MRHAYEVPAKLVTGFGLQQNASGSAYLDSANVAKLARHLLKTAFPKTKFRVRTSRYAGGSSVHIEWTDGPTYNAAMALVKGLEGQGFDGMQDLAYSKAPILLNGQLVQTSCYVFGQRRISDALELRAAHQVATYFGADVIPPREDWHRTIGPDGYHDWSTLVRRAAEDRTRYLPTFDTQPLAAA